MALALSAAGAFLAPRSPRSIRSSKKDGKSIHAQPRDRRAARSPPRPRRRPLFPHDAGLDVVLYDTTLRDGSQQVGISLTCDDKLAVAEHLVALGVGYIEGGYPGSNPKDVEFFQRWFSSGLAERAKAKNVTLAAFGMIGAAASRRGKRRGLAGARRVPRAVRLRASQGVRSSARRCSAWTPPRTWRWSPSPWRF